MTALLATEIVELRKQLRGAEARIGRLVNRLEWILDEAEDRVDGAPDASQDDLAWGRVAHLADIGQPRKRAPDTAWDLLHRWSELVRDVEHCCDEDDRRHWRGQRDDLLEETRAALKEVEG